MPILPPNKPRATREQVLAAFKRQWNHPEPFPTTFIGGVRNYYTNSFDPGGSGRGLYDDAMFVVGPETFAAFNGNNDPSMFKKAVASLLPGFHPYKPGNHGISRPGGGYPAFRPATKNEELPVKRDGEARIPSARPGVAINIHKGGYGTTSSLGCQTLHPDQWDAFYALVRSEMKKAGLKQIWYGLVEGPIL